MVRVWMRWCRLCAREDHSNSHINVLLKDEEDLPLSDTINLYFSIDINPYSNFPNMICTDCYNVISTAIKLNQKIPRVTAMFEDLLVGSEDEGAIKQIRARHNLESDLKPASISKKNPIECEEIDKFPDIAEQMIDQELVHYSNIEINSMNIKMEEEVEDKHDRLASQGDESSNDNDSSSPDTIKGEPQKKIKKKYKSRKERLAENKSKPHCCSECFKGFLKFHNYRRHMQNAHKITIENQNQLFICRNCGKEYKSTSALKEHEVSHSDERTLKCRYCEKTFKSNPSLKIHEDTHNETTYICVVCGLQLNTQRTLRMHMVVHSDQKKHKCEYCGNKYKRAKALKTHLILHTGLKPYVCDFCDKQFANGANCRSHKKKHHPIELAAQVAAGKTKVSTTIIPKLNELKSLTASKTCIVHQNEEDLNEGAEIDLKSADDNSLSFKPEILRLHDLQKTAYQTSLIRENSSTKKESDIFQEIFGPIAPS